MLRNSCRALSLSFICLLFAAGPSGAASQPPDADSWCGTNPYGLAISAAVHRDQERRLARERGAGKALHSLPEASKVGNIAVIVDDGSIIAQPKNLDLHDFGMLYAPQKKGGYVVSPADSALAGDLGERLALGDDDSAAVTFPKGFKFKFFNKAYTKMFVHSDGNLTFQAADAGSTNRDLARLLAGPPRIAPVFTDLNPETAAGEGGVYVLASKTKIVVTWLEVPEFGLGNQNTFQVTLYADGRIAFAFGRLDAKEAIVGIAPGGGGQVQVLDYTADLPTGAIKAAIAERFVTAQAVDDLAVAQAFFREFADDYDHLLVFLDFNQILEGNAFAYEVTIKNEIQGIGSEIYDNTALAGSKGRLRSFVQLGSLSHYSDNPDTAVLRTNSSLDILGHESGHRWLATLHFGGDRNDALLGRQRAHWSFCHNSLASELEGNLIREDGGDRFTTIGATDSYSPLDLYAMGLIPPEDVPPFFYVDGCSNREAAPEVGIVLQGHRVDLTIDDIIAAEGPRVPAANKAPHDFKMAFILVSPPGQFPSEETIAKLDRIRAQWEPYYIQITHGLATVDTTLKTRRGRR